MNSPAPLTVVKLYDANALRALIGADLKESEEVLYCSGVGQFHSTNNPAYPQPYLRISSSDIESMVMNPPSIPKSEAQWAIFSILLSRKHSVQREHGQFCAAWLDIDENPNGLQYVIDRIRLLFPGIEFTAYLTKGATVENQKCRVIIPLSNLCPGQDYVLLQKIVNDRLEMVGIKPDRKTEASGQICYLPNRGELYQYHIEPGQGLEWETDFCIELAAERDRIKAIEIALTARREQSRLKGIERMASGTMSAIDAYNQSYPIEDCLLAYGYTQHGNSRYLSPVSSSGSPGVSIKDDKWISSHESDRVVFGRMSGDAFDIYTYYEHNGDRTAALKAAGEMFMVGDISLTKANQRAYMESLNDPGKIFSSSTAVITCSQPETFDLNRFSLNGSSKAMESQMLDDKFVLACMAILGQSTIFYAKPNVGKTLLIIWLLCDAIKRGELDGTKVFYINADDNHKGLVYKLKLAEEHGFNMLAPGYNNFKTDDLPVYLEKLILAQSATGIVLILDTVKKFTDLMKKDKASRFGEIVRQFVSHGGTVIMLAHVNKHRDDDKKVIYAGTSDLVDDADCAYTLDIVNDNPATGLRTVVFENFKSRGDSIREAFYRYNYADGTPYYIRLESVVAVGEDERRAAEKVQRLATLLEHNRPAIEIIKECIRENINQKTTLIKEAAERSGLSKKRITQVLQDHIGSNLAEYQFWQMDVQEKNAHVFQLNHGVL